MVACCRRIRPWYLLALSTPASVVFTAPYFDNGGAGTVVTAARAIVPSWASQPEGVIGLDLSLRALTTLLFDRTECGLSTDAASYCVLIDDGGFVVWHPSMWDAATADAAFIGQLLPQVCARRLRTSVLTHLMCVCTCVRCFSCPWPCARIR